MKECKRTIFAGGWRRGVTLPEMMVAVSITVLMLLATGAVFKSAGNASGKSLALADMMRQARALCRQLESDFRGLRSDMPMAIIFEEKGYDTDDDTINDTFLRRDRIVFFANGDFQTADGLDSGNVARIFYGQSSDGGDEEVLARRYKILTRRYKILTPLGDDPINSTTWTTWNSPEEYDEAELENSPLSYWKTEDPQNFEDYHFRTWPLDPLGSASNAKWKVSMVRRPNIAEIRDARGMEAVQKLYMLPNVDEVRIDTWYADNNYNWYSPPPSTAFYWNVTDPDGGTLPIDIDSFVYVVPPDNYGGWWSEDDLRSSGMQNPWPRALRFTFRMYDKNYKYYPDGKTFTYIVKLPQR